MKGPTTPSAAVAVRVFRSPLGLVLVAVLWAGTAWAVASADRCWGRSADAGDACVAALTPTLSALGLDAADPLDRWLTSSPPACAAAIDCGSTGGTASVAGAPPQAASVPAGLDSSMPATPAVAASVPAAQPPTSAIVAAAAPASAPAATSVACGGAGVEALSEKPQLSPGEVQCLADIASGKVQAGDPDAQTAAVTLYNRRAAGWQDAVEKALARPGLKNAAALNQAGIAPAYNGQRFEAVLARARAVWTNLDKGYQVDAGGRGFVSEHACRAAVQLEKSGKSVGDGLGWCERWLDLATKTGKGAEDARAHVAELE